MPKLIKLISSDRFLEAPELFEALSLNFCRVRSRDFHASARFGCLVVRRERADGCGEFPPGRPT